MTWLMLIPAVVVGFLLGWFWCSAFATGKREDDNKMFAMLRRGYQRYAERAYRIGYKRGFRHGTPLSVKELLNRWKAERTEPATLLTGTESGFDPTRVITGVLEGVRWTDGQPAQRQDLAGE
jgi:hypothetical protein